MAVNQHGTGAAEVLPTHTPALFDAAVERAAAILQAGGVVALPTETVYGLAANALDASAVDQIFTIKGRPAHNPIIVHVSGLDMARASVSEWPEAAQRLATAFWPGPLSLVLPRSQAIPDNVTAGGSTVGIRWPSHPFIQAVIRRCGFPLAAPSANLSNQLSPTNAQHVQRSLRGRVKLIIDGGQSQVGIESTVVDLAHRPFRVLRPGMIHRESLLATLGEQDSFALETAGRSVAALETGQPLRSPGQLEKHYSPKARLIVCSWPTPAALQPQLSNLGIDPGDCHVVAHSQIPGAERYAQVSVIPHDAEAYARAIYAELHRCDEEQAKVIVAEAVPDTPEWKGIADRLRRAASGG